MQSELNWYPSVRVPVWRNNPVWGWNRKLSVSPCFVWSRWQGKLKSTEFSQVRTQSPAPKITIRTRYWQQSASLVACSLQSSTSTHCRSSQHSVNAVHAASSSLACVCVVLKCLSYAVSTMQTQILLCLQITAVPKTVRTFSKFVSCIYQWGKINGEGWQSSCTRRQLLQNFYSIVHYLLEVGS